MQPAHFLPPTALAPYVAFYGIWDVEDGFSEPFVSPPLGLCGFIICLKGSSDAWLNGNLFMKGLYSFLTKQEKEDIFYNNAARFLQLKNKN